MNSHVFGILQMSTEFLKANRGSHGPQKKLWSGPATIDQMLCVATVARLSHPLHRLFNQKFSKLRYGVRA